MSGRWRGAAFVGAWAGAWRRLAGTGLFRGTFGAAFAASLLAALYWGLIASDLYVSEAHVLLQRTDLSAGPVMDLSSLLGGAGGNSGDQLLLRNHLLSVDMLKKLDARLDLRRHYSDSRRDRLSRLRSARAPLEEFHAYYLSRVSVDFDPHDGVVVIAVQAYDPKTAHALGVALVEEGERYLNAIGHSLAQEQVVFLEGQLAALNGRAQSARQALLDYQNSKGLVSPQSTAENRVAGVNRLESKLTELQTRRSALRAYLMPDSPEMVEVQIEMAAVEKQLKRENARLAAPSGKPLNKSVEEFQRLQMDAEFAQDVYQTALVALEKGRIEATRTLKKVSVLQSPTLPEYPIEPRRSYNTVVFTLVALLIAGIARLMVAIVRDHKD